MRTTRSCSVAICKNTSENSPKKIFVRVPRNPDKAKKWIDILSLKYLNVTNTFVCEDHFNLSEDIANWMYFQIVGSNLILKPHIVPHKFLDSLPPAPLPNQMSETAINRKAATELASACNTKPKPNPKTRIRPVYKPLPIAPKLESNQAPSQSYKVGRAKAQKKALLNTIQNHNRWKIKSITFLKNNISFNQAPPPPRPSLSPQQNNWENYRSRTLQAIFNRIAVEPETQIGVARDRLYVIELLQTVLTQKSIFLTLSKIKQNLPLTVLAFNFGVTSKEVQAIFVETVPILADCLSAQLIRFPAVGRNECVIDSVRFEVRGGVRRYLVAVGGDGAIVFVSDGWCGKVGGRELLEKGGFLGAVPDGWAVGAVDGSFGGAKLVRLKRLRMAVERNVRLVKEFGVFRPSSTVLLSCFDHVVRIACALVNLQNRVILS